MTETEHHPHDHPHDKAPACPECGADRVAAILYGMPGGDWQGAMERGEIVLGGCVIGEDMPKWRCLQCDAQFGHTTF